MRCATCHSALDPKCHWVRGQSVFCSERCATASDPGPLLETPIAVARKLLAAKTMYGQLLVIRDDLTSRGIRNSAVDAAIYAWEDAQ